MDEEAVRKIMLERNALRKGAQLPLIDVKKEVEKARNLSEGRAARARYERLREIHSEKYTVIRDEIVSKARLAGNATFPNGVMGKYLLYTLAEKHFREFLGTLSDHENTDT